MLHDLILALTGHGGDIFMLEKDFTYEVVNDLGFFHPCEVSIIEQLLSIGSNYKKINCFCETYDTVPISKDVGYRGGLYLSSLACALRKALNVYQSCVVDIEQQLLEDPELPLSKILTTLQPLAPLLAAFASLVFEVEKNVLHGCKILEVLHKSTSHSVSSIKEAFTKIEQQVHSVLYDQLTHWMLYGILLDPHNEMFVQTIVTTTTDLDKDDSSQVDVINPLEYNAAKVNEECKLRLEMLPSHIPLRVAQEILFVGESILVFERQDKKHTSIDFTSVASHIGLVLKSKEEEYLKLFHSLADAPTFSILELSKVVETIRHCVSKELCTLVTDADLVSELCDLKSVYLLGRGELYQTLIPALMPYMKLTSKSNNYVNGLFQMAGRQVLLEDEMLDKFTLVWKEQEQKPTGVAAVAAAQKDQSQSDGWKNLRIEYNAKWPLHKLFTQGVQDSYNAIFNFLMDIRRAQYRLQQLWIIQMKTKSFCESTSSLPWTLRHQMSLLIDNIQYYLQVDVLESQHWQLISEIKKLSDYQRLVTAHHNFLVSIASQCFLNNRLICTGLYMLLNLVHKFCGIMEEKYGTSSNQYVNSSRPDKQKNRDITEEINLINMHFKRDAYNLFFSLTKLSLHQRSQFTSQLIMRIDYNKFYSSNAHRFQLSVSDETTD